MTSNVWPKRRLRPVQHELRIREVGELRPVWAFEIFAAATLRIEADEAGNRAVGIDGDRDLAEPQQEPADAARAFGVFGRVAAVDQLHRGWRNDATADARRLQDEGERSFRRAADEAEAIVARMPRQEIGLGIGKPVDRLGVLRDDLDLAPAWDARQRRDGKEYAAAIGAKALRLDDRPGPGRRADVEIGDVLVTLRDLGQERGVIAVGRVDVPARQIALDGGLIAVPPRRVDQQQHADRRAVVVEHIAEARIAFRYGPEGLPAQALDPVAARAADEAARQQVRDRIDVGLGDLAASDLGMDHARLSRGNGRPRPLAPAFAVGIGRDLRLQAHDLPHLGGPGGRIGAVGVEHGDSQAVHAEGDAAGVGRLAIGVLDIPGRAEMLAVIIEAHAGRRLLFRAQRDQQFELELLLLLAHRLHLTDAAEERIAGIIDAEGETEIGRNRLRAHHPALAEIGDVV